MKFSKFGQKFTQTTGISQLMDDMGNALKSDAPINMLGGGNPARIDAVNQVFLQTLKTLTEGDFASPALDSVANYSNPQGDAGLIKALVEFFNRHYDWQLTPQHIALTNGSQNAFFYLFNLFGGEFVEELESGESTHNKAILLPLAPEYIGYSDVHIEGKHFIASKPYIEETTHDGKEGFFKYRVDFDALENLPELKQGKIGAICCSRPTNPTGNVLTDTEMMRLADIAQQYDIPLIIDNAYGAPFPNIIYPQVQLHWDDNTILCFSLSKVGLPGVRTGIVVAHPQVIEAISAMNAIVNLAPTRFGATIATPLLQDDTLKHLSDTVIQPFYANKAKYAIEQLQAELGDTPMRIHKPEGAIFLWLWFKDLPISTTELYQRLKAENTLVVPSEYFFPGLDISDYPHAHQCIRMSIASDDDTLQKGISVIGKIVRELYTNG
ncbi:valine--pyruvate transaminase [Psychrobacter sp. I-STPA6b]|uniref:valine--pyruvate transaminase n=1 Tax=Psychrobacter sp. I-STPA6b TaxID=2585718 RepID=UPI001D0C2A39|nr:valine--pyruvate transaminase [Psychrobacter sp. I-STPA6b]